MWEAYLKGFKAYLQLERSMSDNTVEAYLHDVVVEIQERKSGLPGEADRRSAHVKFGARALIGPELVACGHGAVNNRGDPIIGAAGAKGNLAARVAQTGYAAWGIIIVVGHCWFRDRQNKSKDEWDEEQPLQCTCLHFVPFSPDAFRL